MNIILMGAQGSGKGTQAKMLSEHYKIPHISVGDLLREEKASGSALGQKIAVIIDKGNLVPDKMALKILGKRFEKSDCKKGFIIDGFPRTLGQAEMLDEIITVDFVISLKVDDKLAIERISARRQCQKCGAIYGIEPKPKKAGICDKCKAKLFQRDDDKPEAIKKRLELYHDETEPLLEYYRPKRIVHIIDGSRPPEKVFKEITSIVN